jgi:hypothetical protein
LYNAACCYALCVPAAARGKTAMGPDDHAHSRRYADLAMDTLRHAIACEYNDFTHLQQDADLVPLRSRADFRKLLAEVKEKAKPPAPQGRR